MLQLFPPCAAFSCLLVRPYPTIAHALLQKHSFLGTNLEPFGTCWCIFTQNWWHLRLRVCWKKQRTMTVPFYSFFVSFFPFLLCLFPKCNFKLSDPFDIYISLRYRAHSASSLDICKGYSKRKWSRTVTFESELQRAKNAIWIMYLITPELSYISPMQETARKEI